MTKTILLTGGGSAGHVTPNIALLPGLRNAGFEIHYAGTADGIEHELISAQPDIKFHAVDSGKLRRYASLKNLSDPFKVLKGIRQARRMIREVKPDVVFSKGGFVSVPVVIAAHGRCPVVCHESDYTPGLANKLASRCADTVCMTFEDTIALSSRSVRKKAIHTGTPIRRELYSGDREAGLRAMGFNGKKPVIMVMGGSLGAAAINIAVREALPVLTKDFDIVHLCGRGKVDPDVVHPSYVQFEYVGKELPHMLAATSLMISRAGANAVFEFLSLGIPALLIPLPLEASRGDQILNAEYVRKKGYAAVMEQRDVTAETLAARVRELYANRESMIRRMKADPLLDGTQEVLNVILKAAAGKK